jgi:hypothetical protein
MELAPQQVTVLTRGDHTFPLYPMATGSTQQLTAHVTLMLQIFLGLFAHLEIFKHKKSQTKNKQNKAGF